MRPLELTVNGFRSYGEQTCFDWRGRRLVGIVGPIGSGKSSILDAIAFALYGKTPATSSDTRSLINQRQDLAQVQFTFRVDGVAWQVVRAIKRRGQSQHALYPYDEARGAAITGDAITGATTVTARVEQLLGLDFDAFRRSVLLAQNHFAEFLNARPSDRDNVLKGVFGLDRVDAMREVARERLRAAEADAKDLERRLDEVTQARARLGAWQTERATTETRRTTLEGLRARVETLARDAQAAAQARDAAATRVTQLDAWSKELPAREQSEATIAAFARHAGAGTALRTAREAAEAAAATARTARDATIAEVGERTHLESARRAVDALAHAAQARDADAKRRDDAERGRLEADAALASAHAALKTADAEAKKATTALTRAAKALEGADEARHAARSRDSALTLRRELEAGDPCPVCGRKIARLPAEEETPDLDAADASVETARERRDAAQREASAAGATSARAQATVEAGAQRVATATAAAQQAAAALGGATAQHAAAANAVATLLGAAPKAPTDATKHLDAVAARLTAVEDAVTAAEAAERAARDAEAGGAAALEAARRELTALRVRLASVAARLDLAAPDDDAPAAVHALLAAVRGRWAAERGATVEARTQAQARAREASEARRALLDAAGVPPTEEYEQAVAEVGKRVAALDALLAEAQRQIAAAADAEREGGAIEARRATYHRLADDLTPSKFLRYLLEDERRALAEIGSERFEQLTAGRYRFVEDGTFAVVDLIAAESARAAETLSGGETFLASLSLALALAEMVNREGGRLDAFFLDEGFGSLDEEHLDLAMAGIERLVTESDDRLVVVVSHVPALRDRIEDLIVLDRDAATGDTIVRRGAAAHASDRSAAVDEDRP